MKGWILRVSLICISMILIIGINKIYAQAINPDSFAPNIKNILPHELAIESTGASARLRACSAGLRFKTVSQDEIWRLEIKGTGQAADVSVVTIGINPSGGPYPYPPSPPPGYSVVLKIKGTPDDLSEDVRPPGASQEVWLLTVMMGGSILGGSADASQPGFFPVLTWDTNQIGPAKALDLRLKDANGPVLLDMETNNSYQTKEADISNPSVNYTPAISYALIEYAVVFEPAPLYTFYRDADGDDYGDPNDTIVAEEPPEGYVQDPSDCDDSDPNTNAGALEICDGKDNTCDGLIDIEIADPNNLDLGIEGVKSGLNKFLIKTLCASYSSYDFLLNFNYLFDIASLDLDKRDITGSFMSNYYFFGKICGNGFGLSEDPSHPNLLYIY